MKKIYLTMLVCFFATTIFAQDKSNTIRENDQIESADKVKIEQISKAAQNNAAATVVTYDFTTGDGSQFYGGTAAAIQMPDGKWAMIAGDGNGNGQIQNNDSEDIWAPANGTAGYLNADFNLNGQVQNNDREDFWKKNNGRGSQVPNL